MPAVTVPLSIKTLYLFKYQEENKDCLSCFRLVHKVSTKWRELGHQLDLHPNELNAMEMDNRGPNMTSCCWFAVMRRWMERTERTEVTWEKVYTLLWAAGCAKVARDLKRALLLAKNVKPTVKPQALLPPRVCGDNSEDDDHSDSSLEMADMKEDENAMLNRHVKIIILLLPLAYASIIVAVKLFKHQSY